MHNNKIFIAMKGYMKCAVFIQILSAYTNRLLEIALEKDNLYLKSVSRIHDIHH